MPLTGAEKQRKYRENLKTRNPQKYEEIQRKARERAARYYEIKKSTYTEEHLQELRKKWKKDREKAKDKNITPQNIPTTSQAPNSTQENNQNLALRNLERRIVYRLKRQNVQLQSRIGILTKGIIGLHKKIFRQQLKIDKIQEDYKNILSKLDTEKKTEETNILQELETITPRKRVTEFINCNIRDIETPKKEIIKKKLWEAISILD